MKKTTALQDNNRMLDVSKAECGGNLFTSLRPGIVTGFMAN